MKSRFFFTALAVALSIVTPAFAEGQAAPNVQHDRAAAEKNGVQGTRLTQGTIKGFNYFVDVIDGREMFAKMGAKPNASHHLAIMVMDMKAKKAVEGTKAIIKVTNPNGKTETWNLSYEANIQHMGKDVNLTPGKYVFDGTIMLGNEKKTFKHTLNLN